MVLPRLQMVPDLRTWLRLSLQLSITALATTCDNHITAPRQLACMDLVLLGLSVYPNDPLVLRYWVFRPPYKVINQFGHA
ncbi:hypothetical protein BJ166DRAFT_538941 [Pestalotiopsis sp. NC0098]|nr:hypothetical protein BJ166DRAFT_538941 [Pestalotiopsis sp. NC0098]